MKTNIINTNNFKTTKYSSKKLTTKLLSKVTGALDKLWYDKITGIVRCTNELVQCNEENITCL